MNTLVIDVGGTKFTVAVFKDQRIILRDTRTTDREGGRDWMLGQIAQMAHHWAKHVPLHRCGIGFGGPVDYPSQRVTLSTHVGGWQDFDFPAWVRENLQIPAVMDNDANVGALGEAVFGAGYDCDPVFYMTLSTGIGGGIIQGQRVWRGADSYAGEIGHLTVRPDGPECLCGARGCLERMCCGLWLERDYGKPAYELLEEVAFADRYVVDLALGLKSCIMLLNPARIVIGGGIAKAGNRLFEPLRRELRKQITAWSRARIDVVPAALGDDSILYGALALANELERKEM
ncbi:MAG: ROK family protein [Bryobacterales bacterium]|nr:ROK family protein [Bryobacterales bacterium]